TSACAKHYGLCSLAIRFKCGGFRAELGGTQCDCRGSAGHTWGRGRFASGCCCPSCGGKFIGAAAATNLPYGRTLQGKDKCVSGAGSPNSARYHCKYLSGEYSHQA